MYVSDGTTSVLVDAGLGASEIERRMAAHRLDPSALDAIVVSHEHTDHIRGVGPLSRRHGLTTYFTEKTLNRAARQLGPLHEVKWFDCGATFSIGSLVIHPFSTSHDAVDPAGFTISAAGCKIGLATDLGIATHMVRQHLKDCSALVLEANHDVPMLEEGPYPWPLKQRIKGRTGHLSNEAARDLLHELLHDGLVQVVLAHLSETNNDPGKALEVVGTIVGKSPLRLTVACQHGPGEMLVVP